MANYNPHSPQNIGMEWAAIRDEDLVLDPFANSLERGYGFTLGSSTQLNNVRFYINEFPPLFVRNHAYTANIYPRGVEADSGPVRRVLIPCNVGSIDAPGANVVTSPAGIPVAAAVYNPSANYFLSWASTGSSPASVSFFFATNSYSQLLSGKRILGVNFLTGIDVSAGATANPDDFAPTFAGWIYPLLTNDAFYAATQSNGFVIFRPLTTLQTPTGTRLLVRTRMGDADLAFGNQGELPTSSPNISQWTYTELQRFESTAGANRIFMTLHDFGITGGITLSISYVALEVFYCEERRVAFGTRNIMGLRREQSRDPFQLGMNQIIVRTPAGATNPILTPGDYTVTLSEANTGDDFNVAYSPFETAKVNELRQLYEIPTVPGVQVNLPFPLNDEAVGTTLTKESTELLPQLSLHASGGAVFAASHPYGRQAAAQVWGSVQAIQEINTSAAPAGVGYPHVRFYARRFGNTTAPLLLDSPSFAATATLTPAEYDALPEILDGWKQIDKTLTPAPELRSVSSPTWRWSALGEFAGSRWEVLAQSAYAASGIAQQMPPNIQLAQVPTAQQLYAATYPALSGAGSGGMQLPGTSGNYASTPDVAALDIVGDIELQVDVTMNATIWNTGTPTFLAKWNGAQRSYRLDLNGSGAITFFWSTTGADTNSLTSTAAVPTNTSRLAIRATFDVNNGGGGSTATFYTAPTISGPWTQLGAPVIGAVTNIFASTAQGEVGGRNAGTSGLFAGTVHAAKIVNGLAGTEVANPDFDAQTPGTTVFADAAGRTWTLNGTAAIIAATAGLSWMPQLGPYVTTNSNDPTADATIIFAQNMPTVTGFGVSVVSQAVTGIGQDCGIDPCGIPTHILYNQLSWGLPVNTGVASDDFNRVVASGWGTASDGKVWQNTDAGNSVNGTHGLDVVSTGAVRMAWVDVGGPDQNVTATVSMDTVPATFQSRVGVAARITDASNYYSAELQYESTGIVRFLLRKRVAGVGNDLVDFVVQSLGMSITASRKVRIEIVGSLIRGKIWDANIEEPTWWQLETTDTSLTTGNNAGTFARNEITGSPTVTYSYDNFSVTPPTTNFGYYELQRSDSITDWATIMKSTSVATTGFKDYEARIGLSSSYRIRGADAYDFTGPWSSTVSVSTISPGVSGSCLSDAHVMVFTTNERQDGSSNLAYSNAWEGEVEEGFSFAEAGFTQLQPMYDKDFFTAFRPTERGGEQFSRDVLVQAAAISPPTLGDFRSLRDMAWDSVSYICVRDEDGNRWFANVNVPSGVVRNRRRLYIASVQIVEVTDTPAEVDP